MPTHDRPLLTMIVSLEAIFLSTFVMISQNRADAKRQVIADQQWKTVQEEDSQNRELIDLSNQILDLTKAVTRMRPQRPARARLPRWTRPERTALIPLGAPERDPAALCSAWTVT